MMLGLIFLFVLVVLLAAGVLFKIVRSVLRFVLYAALAFSVIVLVLGAVVFVDSQSFADQFEGSSKKFLVVDEGVLLWGVDATNLANPVIISDDALAEMKESYSAQDLEALRGTDYKLVILSLQEILGVVYFKEINVTLSPDEVREVMRSDNGTRIISSKLYYELNDTIKEQISFEAFHERLMERLGSNSQIRLYAFASMLKTKAGTNITPFLLNGIKKGAVMIYPETALFRALKLVPKGVLENYEGV